MVVFLIFFFLFTEPVRPDAVITFFNSSDRPEGGSFFFVSVVVFFIPGLKDGLLEAFLATFLKVLDAPLTKTSCKDPPLPLFDPICLSAFFSYSSSSSFLLFSFATSRPTALASLRISFNSSSSSFRISSRSSLSAFRSANLSRTPRVNLFPIPLLRFVSIISFDTSYKPQIYHLLL